MFIPHLFAGSIEGLNSVSVCWTLVVSLTKFPTAQAWPELGSAAAASKIFWSELGLGLVTILQLLPFHCSMSVCSPVLEITNPTAQMSVAETMATPLRRLFPVRFGLGTTLHFLPFQCSVSVLVLLNSPTAQTSLEETAVTPNRKLLPVPLFALVTTLQLVPFQCRVSVRGIFWALSNHPTAQTSFVAMAVTAWRTFMDTLGLGLATTLQLVPSQCSISVCLLPLALMKSPTAHTSLAETLATPLRSLTDGPGLGLGTTLQAACACATAGASSRASSTAPTMHKKRLTFKRFMILLSISCSPRAGHFAAGRPGPSSRRHGLLPARRSCRSPDPRLGFQPADR